MGVTGTVQLLVSLNGNSARVLALVSTDLTNDMLVSWYAMVDLGILPQSFPLPARAFCASPAGLVPSLRQEFGAVLSDELSMTPMTESEPMHVYLAGNVVPVYVSTPRKVPLRYQTEAGKTIADLVLRKVIVPVSVPTSWCSPAFFVPKVDNKRVRLVTDYTALNKFVQRPTHPFPSSRDIMQAVPPSAKVFAKMDAVHGYFQLALDEASSALTTLLLESGRYVTSATVSPSIYI